MAVSLFPAVPACRARPEGERAALPGRPLLLVPVCCLVVRLVLTYRAVSVGPVLSPTTIAELLAVVFLTLAFYRLSSFAFRAGRTRRFALYAVLAIVLLPGRAGRLPDTARLLFYLGGALTLLRLPAPAGRRAGRPLGRYLTVYHKIPAGVSPAGGDFRLCSQMDEQERNGPAFRLALFLFFGRLDEKKFCLLQVLRYRRVVKQTSANCYKSLKSIICVPIFFVCRPAARRRSPPAPAGTPPPGSRPPGPGGWESPP